LSLFAFSVFNYDFIKCNYFADIEASITVLEDVRNQIMHRIFMTSPLYSNLTEI